MQFCNLEFKLFIMTNMYVDSHLLSNMPRVIHTVGIYIPVYTLYIYKYKYVHSVGTYIPLYTLYKKKHMYVHVM